ncbi:glycosyltransferase 87 family protein [Ornithinimicrobium sufpigmenti]|uniref:glycosyltransferase 87 family protein n=1 Tax=Ornithinimicrobium sufpigmenti TaxID=2508882 RepID=UPI001035BF98|nr:MULTISPECIES: glycosyltransferase 87 family protein [unclassified Ornithinimicrobium]
MPLSGDRTRRDVPWLVPSWSDPVVRRATGVLGGPAGRYAVVGARGLAGVAAAVVLLGTLNLALAVWTKGHCLLKGWSTPDHFWRACYSDLPVVHVSSPLADGLLPWAGETPSNQPPLSGLVMWLISLVSPVTGTGVPAQQWTLVLWAVLCVPLLAAGVLAVVALQPPRPWQSAQLALSPVLTLLVLVSTDLLGITLTLLALWAWRRERSWVAGVLLGLALLVRPFPLLVLAAMVLVAWRQQRRLPALQAVVGAALGALLVLVPLLTVEPRALAGLQQWWGQGAGYGAPAMVPQLLGAPLVAPATVAIAVTGWVVALALGAWLTRRPGRVPLGVVQLSAVMLLVVVLTAPSLSVQSGLWLLPLLALSARPWWEHLVWALAEALHFLATWLHIAYSSDPGRGLPPETYALVVLLRAAAWSWILWRIWSTTPVGPRRAAAQPPSSLPGSRAGSSRVDAGSPEEASATSGATASSTTSRRERM